MNRPQAEKTNHNRPSGAQGAPQKGPGRGQAPRGRAPGRRPPRRLNVLELVQRMRAFFRRRICWILGIAAVLVLTAGILLGTALVGRLTRTVTAVTVEGESPYTAEELIEAAGITVGQRAVSVNEGSTARRLRNAFEYLDEVTVTVAKDGTVTLTVRQVEACFRLRAAGKVFALTDQLLVLEMADSPDELYDTTLVDLALPQVRRVVVGEPVAFGEELDVTAVEAIFALFAEDGFGRISELDLSNRYRIRLLLDGRFDVTLGDWTGLSRKVAVLDRILRDERYAQAALVEVNLSDPNQTWARIVEDGAQKDGNEAETAGEDSQ